MGEPGLPRTIFRSPFWNAWLGILALLAALIGAAGVGHSHSLGRFVWGVIAIGCATLAIRAFRAGVIVDGRGLTARGFIRTRRIPWSDVAEVRAENSGNVTGAGRCIALVLTDGSRVHARGVSGYTDRVTRVAGEIAALRPESPDSVGR
jgi:Bacterial PH domain